MGVTLSDLFATSEEIRMVNSRDKTVMEKVALIEQLSEKEKQANASLDKFNEQIISRK